MSFVMFAGCKTFGVMFGDKRSIDKHHNIVSDTEKKVIRINDNLVICGGGAVDLINCIFKPVYQYPDIKNLSYDECVKILVNRVHEIKDEYAQFVTKYNLMSSIGVMGFNNAENISCLSISFLKEEIRINEKEYKSDNDSKLVFYAYGIDSKLSQLFHEKLKKNNEYSIQNLERIFYQILLEESQNDISINTDYDMEYLINKKYL